MILDQKRLALIEQAPLQMTLNERLVLYALVLGMEPARILEIGTFRGGSAMIMCAALDELGSGQIVSIDPAPQIAPEHWQTIEHRTTFVEEVSPAAIDFARERAGGPFDLALIDGDRSFEAVVNDIESTLPILAEEAHLLVHDAHFFDVRDAINRCLGSHPDELTDAGLVAAGKTWEGQVVDGKNVYWGGLRLLRYRRSLSADLQ